MKDLEFIRSVVKEWPRDAHTVRLDKDGEIGFKGQGHCNHDFFPDNIFAAKAAFVPKCGFCTATSFNFTREQWENGDE